MIPAPTGPVAVAALVARAMLLAGMLLCVFRVWRGPRTADRVVALDTIAYLTIGLCGLRAIEASDAAMLRPALPLALLAFLATVAFARYLEKRAVNR
ncbi:MAG TPA: monovalent cation/H+ antiporter complex subunit F [Sandaracinaceae bacterium LLY-WYZ-13_1]|nr:monovalent cation/H+ antiporter complex subunit F [Sandaracinaceae bacterium LLY-WYZ-13_1]